jgi:ATP-dependent exoDNAse (exonuclease V) beta subunit
LQVTESFIVQAPAGSGKTELLTQRFLALLAVAEKPEAILAMTFTKKAASEMRSRIMGQLRHAQEHPQADTAWKTHELATWQLARNALARDADCGWQLLKHPARLRIQTIDAFCSSLVLQMPYLSRLGGMARTTEDASLLYHEAARATLQALDDDEGGISEALFCVLGYLDNQRSQLQMLISEMLGRREQWLRHIRPGEEDDAFRSDLQYSLQCLGEQMLTHFFSQYGVDWLHALKPMLMYAAACLRDNDVSNGLTEIGHWPDFDRADADAVPALKAIAAFLLTGKGDLRSKMDVRSGFPPAGEHHGHDA